MLSFTSSFSSSLSLFWFLETWSCNYFRMKTSRSGLDFGIISGQDVWPLFECCNYFGVKTSKWKFCVATMFGSKVAKLAPRRILVFNYFRFKIHGWTVTRTSRFLTCLVRSFLSFQGPIFVCRLPLRGNHVWGIFCSRLHLFRIFVGFVLWCLFSFLMDFLHPFELLLFPTWSCVRLWRSNLTKTNSWFVWPNFIKFRCRKKSPNWTAAGFP